MQAQGLIGSHGILPLAKFIDAVAGRFGAERFFLAPMVFWLNDSDAAIQAVCWAGAGLSLLLVVNVLPRLCLFLLFALYLSLFYAGQIFMSYQWDLFLLEMGFAALLLSFATTPGIFLLRWLMFRFMFMSGVVKLLSGDPSWWNLSALAISLSHPAAAHAARLVRSADAARPLGVRHRRNVLHRARSALFHLRPAPLRFIAAFGFLLLEVCILITGNYNWFNLQTMLLCLPLFDDAALRKILPARLAEVKPKPERREAGGDARRQRIGVADRVLQPGADGSALRRRRHLRWRGRIDGWIRPLNVVSGYGLFAIMTTNAARDRHRGFV